MPADPLVRGLSADDPEAEDKFLRVGFAGAQDAAGVAKAVERGLVRRIGEESRFEAEALAEGEGLGPAALDGAGEEVASVELEARGVGEDFKRAAGGCFGDEGGGLQRFIRAKVIAVVVAAATA